MPRRSFRRNFKRRRRLRRRRPHRSLITNHVPRGPLPNSFKAKLVYQQTVQIDPPAGTCASNLFACNGLYDPDISGTGHQPRGFDEMMLLYEKYTVIGSRIKVIFAPVSTGASNDSITYGVHVRDDSSVAESDYNNYVEQGNGQFQVSDINIRNSPVYATWSAKKFHSLKDPLNAGSFAGTNIANPDKGARYHVWACATDQATNVAAHSAFVVMEFIVVFHEPKDMIQS